MIAAPWWACHPGLISKQASTFSQQSFQQYWAYSSLVCSPSLCSFFSDCTCKMGQRSKGCELLRIRDDVCEVPGVVPNPWHLSSGCYDKEPYSRWLTNNRDLFLISWVWCFQFKVSAWQGSQKSPRTGCRMPTSPIFTQRKENSLGSL